MNNIVKTDIGSGRATKTSKEIADSLIAQLENIQKITTGLEVGYQEKLSESLLSIYNVARKLERDDHVWYQFCREPIWLNKRSKPKPEKKYEALRFALRRAIGFGKAEDKRVSKYFHTFNSFFIQGKGTKTVRRQLEQAGSLGALSALTKSEKGEREARTTRSKTTASFSGKFTKIDMRKCLEYEFVECRLRFTGDIESPKVTILRPIIDEDDE